MTRSELEARRSVLVALAVSDETSLQEEWYILEELEAINEMLSYEEG